MIVLFPQDPFSPRAADEHFAEEAEAARALGHQVAFVDHDALTDPERVAEGVRRVPAEVGELAVYRGWMLTSKQYERFADALGDRDVRLRTSAEDYRRGHELPGWYEMMRPFTPESVWLPGESLESGPAIVRDFVKSEKHYWDEAMFIPDVADSAAVEQVVGRFLDLRGDWLAGGLVFRRFEEFRPPEVRTWWVDGRLVLVSPHPDDPATAPPPLDLTGIDAAVRRLDLPFVTVDVVRAGDTWRVVEVGDGQVSDRARSTPADAFVDAVLSG